MKPLAISDYTVVSALGRGVAAHARALREGTTGLAAQAFEHASAAAPPASWLGVVAGLDAVALPGALAGYDCRNNRLAELALTSDTLAASVARARDRHGAARVGLFVGTSTSGILQTELAYRERDPVTGALPSWLHYDKTHNTYAAARYLRERLGLAGPAFVISTACSSGAKAFAAAARLIAHGVIDAALVGGVDSLCLTTLYGFASLELLSPEICRPWDAGRRGLSLGEGAAFALLERSPERTRALLLGCGESSDGHHMSSPLPDGAGAAAAMRQALADAGLAPGRIDHLNLHGTGTHGNDAAEDRAVCTVFGETLPCSSTKGATGHTLGAAGAVEAVLSLLTIEHGVAPANLNLRERDPALHAHVLREPLAGRFETVASNSFGFGGSNACLVFGAAR